MNDLKPDLSNILQSGWPKDLCFVRSMLQIGERQALYHLAASTYTGEGEIIDAGAFVGGSAYCFGLGLHDNPNVANKAERIHSFDTFIAQNDYYVQFLQTNFFTGFQTTPESAKPLAEIENGYDFEGIYRFQTASFKDSITVNKGFVQKFPWPANKLIEILFIDIAKTQRTNDYCVMNYFPAMIPGKTILIQQDLYTFLGYLHLIMEYFTDYFDVLVPQVGTSRVYLYKKEIPADLIKTAVTEYMDVSNGVPLYNSILEKSTDHEKPLFHSAFVHYLSDVGEMDLCRAEADRCLSLYDSDGGQAYWHKVITSKILPGLDKTS